MTNGRKRARMEPDENRAECPFSVTYVNPADKEKKHPKRRRQTPDDDENKKAFQQLSPFTPTGKFKTHETMDLHYKVDPHKAWIEMTRYNSFVRK